MRLDKFLKVSRLIKRRTIAAAMCQAGRVAINGKVAKASTTLNVGDVMVLSYGNRSLTVSVVMIPEKITPALNSPQGAQSLYSVVGEAYNETGSASSDDTRARNLHAVDTTAGLDALFLDLLK
jgi:ribosomal 50S subunit-recycling heat shock protein